MRTDLKITTFNLLNYLEPPNAYYELENIYTNEQWQKKQKWITDMLKEADSDVVCFQEVFSPDSLKQLMLKSGYDYFSVIDAPTNEESYLYSDPVLAIASRFPIRRTVEVKPNEKLAASVPFSEPFAFSRKPIHATLYVEGTGEIELINVHLKSQRAKMPQAVESEEIEASGHMAELKFGRWLSTIQRGFESHFLNQYIWQLKQQDGKPFIVAGDFNKSIESDEIRVLLDELATDSHHSDSRAPLLFDSWKLYCGQFGNEKDFLQWSRKPTHYHGAIGNTLDYILLSEEFDSNNSFARFNVVDYSVIDQHIINPQFELDRLSSDHAVVTVTIELR
ncbi:endonuclease/exonuclease/phosphatase family protein [Vibrio sp. HN007]|uniref:endonuclease/exonuclease/phosphatase family protein n=1 Tax=Vibrio iocasae TaxID=3098914 RepID=UPI0035D4BDF1